MKAQQWLLHLMLLDDRVRQRVAEEGVEQLFYTADYRRLAVLVLQRGAVGGSPAALLAEDLSEEQKAFLSGILIKDENVFADDPKRIFDGCRKAVEKERLKQRIDELDALIRQAEAAGDLNRRTAYQSERIQVNRKLKNSDL